MPNIASHRQVTPGGTSCSGDKFMALLPTIRQRVSTRIQGGVDIRPYLDPLKQPSA